MLCRMTKYHTARGLLYCPKALPLKKDEVLGFHWGNSAGPQEWRPTPILQ